MKFRSITIIRCTYNYLFVFKVTLCCKVLLKYFILTRNSRFTAQQTTTLSSNERFYITDSTTIKIERLNEIKSGFFIYSLSILVTRRSVSKSLYATLSFSAMHMNW